MIPSQVAYQRPNNIKDALQLINDLGDDCKILAGGHSLIPVMKLRLNDPENLVDITGIAELKEIRDNDNSITIGACATHNDIAKNKVLQHHAPIVSHAANMIGDVQVRNFGTIGGSIAHADPAADWPAVLLATNATIVIKSVNGQREVDVDQFFKGLFWTALEDGEMITAIRIPKTAANKNSTYVKFVQPASRFAIVGCAAAIDKGNEIRVAFSGVSATPFRDSGIEEALMAGESIESATTNVADSVDVMSDHFAKAKYRKHLASVYARKALSQLM
jgi:carbon-monoxide dehydrogenase medium subunit